MSLAPLESLSSLQHFSPVHSKPLTWWTRSVQVIQSCHPRLIAVAALASCLTHQILMANDSQQPSLASTHLSCLSLVSLGGINLAQQAVLGMICLASQTFAQIPPLQAGIFDPLCLENFVNNPSLTIPNQTTTPLVLGWSHCIPVNPPVEVTLLQTTAKTAQLAATASSVASTVALSPGGALQASRMNSISQVLSCKQDSSIEPEPLSFGDSPTAPAIGDSNLRYMAGAVVGNSIVLATTSSLAALLSAWKSSAAVRAPGVLILPTLLLLTPTTASAVTLLRFGTSSEQALGGSAIGLEALGLAGVGFILSPSQFHAAYHQGKWADLHEKGFVHRYGFLFKEYHWHGFMVVELLMATASGILQSYQVTDESCQALKIAAASVYGVYAATVLGLRPHHAMREKIYFGAVALIQFSPLALNVIDSKTETIAKNILTGLQLITLCRGLYDAGMTTRSLYLYLTKAKAKEETKPQQDAPTPQTELLTNPLLSVPPEEDTL